MKNSELSRVDFLRSLYRKPDSTVNNDAVSSIKEILVELKVQNELLDSSISQKISNSPKSPYLHDQENFNTKMIYQSDRESDWKKVPSFEETYGSYTYSENQIRKLNIL